MALFVPNPDGPPVEELIEQLALEIAARYAAAEDELIRELAVRARRDLELQAMAPTAPAGMGLTAVERRRQNRILAELAAHRANSIRELQFVAAAVVEKLRADDLARQVIEIAAREGEAAAAARLGLAARVPVGVVSTPFIDGVAAISTTTLSGTATQAVASIVFSLESRLEALNQRLTRYPQDAYQRIVALSSPNTLLGVTTSRVQQAATVQRFLGEGITDFIDRANRRWTIGSYAEMAGRTSVNRAFNDAGVWRMQQSGINLVTVVRGLDSCKKCADWAGKILSTDGTTGAVELPRATGEGTITVFVAATVDQARNAGWNHPNCRCRLVPYLPGLTIPQAATTYDPVAEAERAEQRRLEREIRAAKRAEATAPDDITRARARADVREAQAEMRAFIRQTGRQRQSYREQLGFADGRGPAARPTPTPPRPPREPRPPQPKAEKPKQPRGGLDIRIGPKSPLGVEVRAARSSIAKVHSIPTTLTNLPVTSARLRPGVRGQYEGAAGALKMAEGGASPRLTFAHEVGHWLDHRWLGSTDTNFETRVLSDDRTKAWLDAVRETPAVKALERIAANPLVSDGVKRHVSYLLNPVELWGRSYAQYIATRSADDVMLAEVALMRGSAEPWTRNRQWSTTEFEPVADAIDAIFKSKGALK